MGLKKFCDFFFLCFFRMNDLQGFHLKSFNESLFEKHFEIADPQDRRLFVEIVNDLMRSHPKTNPHKMGEEIQ